MRKPSLGGVGVSCLEIVSLGFPVSLFYFTQPSRLIFPLVFAWCAVKSAAREAESEKQSEGAEGRTG